MPLRRLHKHLFATHHEPHDDHHDDQQQQTLQQTLQQEEEDDDEKREEPQTEQTTAAELIPSSRPISLNDAPAPTRPLGSSTATALNSMQGPAHAAPKHVLGRTATIRTVPSFDGSDSSHEGTARHNGSFEGGLTSKASGLSAIASNGSFSHRTPSPSSSPNTAGSSSRDGIPGRRNITPTTPATTASASSLSSTTSRTATSSTETTTTSSTTTSRTTATATAAPTAPNNIAMNGNSVRWTTTGLRAGEQNSYAPTPPQPPDHSALSDSEHDSSGAGGGGGGGGSNGQWDSTIGKAGLGKTGRVINKLVSDNDALKRELQIERLKAEEARQAARLIEDKMERLESEYESRLLEANVTKTLLSRKERQVESLTAAVDLERKKSQAAQELERGWKDEMGKARAEAKAQVDEATGYAQLMEGRYNAISSHWRGQGEEVSRAVGLLRGEISGIIEARRCDDGKIQTLRELCEQQDGNIRALRREKEDIARLFEEYKRAQEEDLREIKAGARRREEEQERLLGESREALDKLKWALNIEKNVKLRDP